jgi:ATP-dependent Zn protease
MLDLVGNYEQERSLTMKSKTKSIVFFVVLIVVVAVLALVIGDRTEGSKTKATYTEFLQQVQAGEVSKATIAVAETGANPVTYRLKSGSEWLTIIPRNYQDALAAMQSKLVNVEIRDAQSQRVRTLANASPFLLLLVFWAAMMIWMRKNPNFPNPFRG